MAPPAWLPPLNSHDDYTIYAHIHDYTSVAHARQWNLDNPPRDEPTFLINLVITVEFHGKQFIHNKVITGLNLITEVPIPSTINLQTLPAVLEQELINHYTVPFRIDHCKWDVNCFLDKRIGPCWEEIEDREELLKRMSLFLLHLKDKPENRNRRNLLLGLEFLKDVAVEEDEFESWLHWYKEQMRVDPEFEGSYRSAIERPRSSIDIGFYYGGHKRAGAATEGLKSVVYDGKVEEKPCSICLEEFTGGSRVICLPCLHVYHEGCVLRWLRSRRACPLCRYELAPEEI